MSTRMSIFKKIACGLLFTSSLSAYAGQCPDADQMIITSTHPLKITAPQGWHSAILQSAALPTNPKVVFNFVRAFSDGALSSRVEIPFCSYRISNSVRIDAFSDDQNLTSTLATVLKNGWIYNITSRVAICSASSANACQW